MIRQLTAISFCLLLLAACSQDNNTPEMITRQFITKMGEGDNEGAGAHATERTHRFLAFRTQSMEMLGEDPIQPMLIESIQCETDADKAYCEFCCDPNGEKMVVPLVKRGEEWLVDIEIDELIKEFEQELEREE